MRGSVQFRNRKQRRLLCRTEREREELFVVLNDTVTDDKVPGQTGRWWGLQ